MDALLKYAMDPNQWEALATELDLRRGSIDLLDPHSFLTLLSQAESLAWHMHSQPPSQLAGCAYLLLNERGDVVYQSDQTPALKDLLEVDAGQLTFSNNLSHKNFATALQTLRARADGQELVELIGPHQTNYGYLMPTTQKPAAFNDHPQATYAFLIALSEPDERVSQVLQASFHLTAAEIAVCMRLCRGLALKEVAETLSISTNTARNHLQAVFEKTGLNRQSDLILMMTQLSVVLAVISGHTSSNEEELPASDYPQHFFAITADERKIAYRVYGAGSRQVMYLHESAGTSRLLPGTAEKANALDLRIVAVERPGSGFSDPVKGYDFNTSTSDLITVMDQLGIGEADLLGFMSGAGHALAAATDLGSRVRSLFLISGRAPQPFPEGETNKLALLRYGLMNRPWLLTTFFNILRTRSTPSLVRSSLLKVYGSVQHDKQLLLNNEAIMRHMVGYAMENMTVSGAGISGEIQCFSRPTNLDLTQISAPVRVWHGEQDSISPWQSFKTAVDPLQPDYRLFPECGSLLMLEFWDEVLSVLSEPT